MAGGCLRAADNGPADRPSGLAASIGVPGGESSEAQDAAARAAATVPEGAVVVEIRNWRYHPDDIRVRPGTPIVFVNRDEESHNVVHGTSQRVGTQPPAFESPLMEPGTQWTLVLEEPGEYPFLCTVSAHQLMGMVGRITVVQE